MKRRIVAYNAINILFSVTYAILALVFVLHLGWGVYGIFAAMLTANILQYALSIFLIRDSFAFNFSKPQLSASLRFAFPLFPAALVTWVNRQTDRLILLAFLGLSNVAVFGVGSRLAGVINLLAAIFRQAWVPFSLSVIEESDEKTRDLFYSKVANYFISFFFAISIAIVAISPDVIRILFPPEYAQAALVVPWLLGATILHASGDFTNLGTVISKKTIGNSIAAVIGAITNVLLAFILIPKFGIAGASIGVFAAEFLFTAILGWFSYRSSKILFDTKILLTIIGGYCVASIFVLQISSRVEDNLLSISGRLVVASLFAIFFLRLGLDELAKDLAKKVFSRLKNNKGSLASS
jgi:O-antigen/teichoic acid export membrane protein